ncbi:MAG: capsular biosynthesis protein [Cyclobacteriaceae bacterium]|nr:capsular biosynthesis protein [Cyclobacteriaceae bacterium]
MLGWLKKKRLSPGEALITDMHSHLLPGLDDGVKTLEEAEAVVRVLMRLGYRKLITTPHVMQDHYRNTPETILGGLEQLRNHLRERNIEVQVEAAAEYYLDEYFIRSLESGSTPLTFGDGYLLFETNFLSEPLTLNEFIFAVTTRGYRPVLAHPERYLYLQDNLERIEDLANRGVLFQLNLGSLAGFYSRAVQVMAGRLIDRKLVHFLGSDCHNLQHAEGIARVARSRYFEKAINLRLINHDL